MSWRSSLQRSTQAIRVQLMILAVAGIGATLWIALIGPAYWRYPLLMMSVVGIAAFGRATWQLYAEIRRTIWRSVNSWAVFAPLMTILSLALASGIVASLRNNNQTILVSPGTLFLVTVATITTLSTIVTLSRIGDLHGRILDYSHLVERMRGLLIEEQELASKGHGQLSFVTNFPAFGSISAPDTYSSYSRILESVLDDQNINGTYAFLNWGIEGSANRMKEFVDRFPLNDTTRAKKLDLSAALLSKIVATSEVDGRLPKTLFAFREHVREVPFHVMVGTLRAIVAVALNYPVKGGGLDSPMVHVIGFETTDQAIVSELRAGLKARLVQEADPVVNSHGAWRRKT